MGKEGDTEPSTGLTVFKAAADLVGKDSVFTQLAEAIGLTHRARARKAISLAEIARAYNLPWNDPDTILAMAEQSMGLTPAAVDRLGSRIKRDQARLEAAAEEVAVQHEAEKPGQILGPVSEEKLDAWCDHVTGISDESMRATWARLIRIEAAAPGSFSLRGMAALKLFSKEDARILVEVASRTFQGSWSFLLLTDMEYEGQVSDLEALHARSINIISSEGGGYYKFLGMEPSHFSGLDLPDRRRILVESKVKASISIPATALTPLGMELVQLPTVKTNRASLNELISRFDPAVWDVSVVQPSDDDAPIN